jgi:hypothetical protein
MKLDLQSASRKPDFWWKNPILVMTLGLIAIVFGVFVHNPAGEHIANIGTYVLAAGIVVWILRLRRS